MTALIVIGAILAYFGIGLFGARFAANAFYKHNKKVQPQGYRGVDASDRMGVCVLIFLFWPLVFPAHLIWLGTRHQGAPSLVRRFFLPQEAKDRRLLEKAADLEVLAGEMLKAGEKGLSASLLKASRELQREAKG